MAKLRFVMYFAIVAEFTTALPRIPCDRKPIDSRGARAAFWDGTVAVQDRLYTPQSNPRYNAGTIHPPTILFRPISALLGRKKKWEVKISN